MAIWPERDCGEHHYQNTIKFDAGDELRIPLKPFLAILHVMGCCFLFPTFFSNFMIKKIS
jgi:hypothetical protein